MIVIMRAIGLFFFFFSLIALFGFLLFALTGHHSSP